MDHDAVRAALVSDEAVPAEANAHLARCEACLDFARGLDRVRRAAPLLVPGGPPEGLADRVVAALPAAPVVPVTAARSFGRRALVRVAAGVAATLVVGAAAVALREDDPGTPQARLVAAARRTERAGTAKVRVRGTATFALPTTPTRSPNFGSLPDEIQARAEAQWDRAMRAFRDAMRRYEDAVNRALDRIDDIEIPGVPGIPRPSLPPIQVPTPPRPPAPPELLTTTVRVAAEGDVAFDDRLRLSGTVAVDADAPFDLVSGRDGVAVRAGGDWSVATGQGPWSSVLASPGELVRLVTSATDVLTVDDSTYTFAATTLDGTRLSGRAQVDGDGRLVVVSLHASGRAGGPLGATWRTDLRVEITEPGAPVAPEPVRPGDVTDRAPEPDSASRVLYPFGVGVRAAVEVS